MPVFSVSSSADGRQTGLKLELSDLRVVGAAGQVLLEIAGLTLEPGTCLCIRGPSGAGKSTLLNAIAGLLRPVAGRVVWGGTDIVPLSDTARAAFRLQSIGMIFQDFLLFEELGCLANAAIIGGILPRRARTALAANARAALARLGLGDKGERPVASFSGGERQRVAVARALANDPAVILADEPTASLDRAAADRLIADLSGLARTSGKTLITVSHDPAMADAMDRVIDLRDGRIAGPEHV